jgi:3'(2'), 5'-bisphosphate nucleotidase
MSSWMQDQNLANKVISIARGAGEIILKHYNHYRDRIDVEFKEDSSPVTIADKESSQYILERLPYAVSGSHIPMVCEELDDTQNAEIIKSSELYWLVDPLDGTKGFIKRDGTFTINIALISAGQPVFGLLYLPLSDETYFALDGKSYYRLAEGKDKPIYNDRSRDDLHMLASHHHRTGLTIKVLEAMPEHRLTTISSAVKFCMMAKGEANFYVHMGPTSIWDTAAGQAIVQGAGCRVWTRAPDHQFDYSSGNLENPQFLVYQETCEDLLEVAKKILTSTE